MGSKQQDSLQALFPLQSSLCRGDGLPLRSTPPRLLKRIGFVACRDLWLALRDDLCGVS
jgi:hypothetical protein